MCAKCTGRGTIWERNHLLIVHHTYSCPLPLNTTFGCKHLIYKKCTGYFNTHFGNITHTRSMWGCQSTQTHMYVYNNAMVGHKDQVVMVQWRWWWYDWGKFRCNITDNSCCIPGTQHTTKFFLVAQPVTVPHPVTSPVIIYHISAAVQIPTGSLQPCLLENQNCNFNSIYLPHT